MSSGDTLLIFHPLQNEPPAANYATIDARNGHYVLDFDATTQEAAYFSGLMPRLYGGGGVTVYLHATSDATSGTLGWLVAFERLDAGTDIDADSFASDQTATAATVPGTSGQPLVLSVAVSNGANMDGIAAGDAFRLRVQRDVANDTAAADANLLMVEIKES